MAVERMPDRERARRGGERVAHVVHARGREHRARLARGRAQRDLARQAAERSCRVTAAAARGRSRRARRLPARLRKNAGVRVVGVDHRDAVGRQRVGDRARSRRDLLDRAHELQVLALRVVDQRDVGRAMPAR